MQLKVFLAALLFSFTVRAELPPSAYESMQAKASEYVRIEVLRVDVEPGEDASQQVVHLVALVTEVIRTATELTTDGIVEIHYTITDHPEGWVGPGELPLLHDKVTTIAYLNKLESGDYVPAAGRMSFSNF
jgi:hypothetical protein